MLEMRKGRASFFFLTEQKVLLNGMKQQIFKDIAKPPGGNGFLSIEWGVTGSHLNIQLCCDEGVCFNSCQELIVCPQQ